MKERMSYLGILIFWLLVIKAASVALFCYADIGLMPIEVYLWEWSKTLVSGSYSNPPAAAYQIAGGTALFGDTELGVRFFAAVLSFFLSIAIYFLALKGGLKDRSAFYSALAFSLTPVGFLSANLATPDCGFLLFWTLASTYFASALIEDRPAPFIKIGIMVALGALFKWAIYFLWLPIFLLSLRNSKCRFSCLFGFLISLLALLPVIPWNYEHHWIAFQHVYTSFIPHGGDGNGWQFFVTQVVLLSPVLFALLVWAVVGLGRQLSHLPASIVFYWWTSVASFVLVSLLAYFRKVQMNCALMALPTLFPLFFAYVAMKKEWFMRLVQVALVLSIAFIATGMLTLDRFPYKKKPFHDAQGWKALERGLEQVGYNPEKFFLFSNRYHTVGLLSFYSPGKSQAYFLNTDSVRPHHLINWPALSNAQLHKNGFFVMIVEGAGAMQKAMALHVHMQKVLAEHFKEVSNALIILPLDQVNGEVVKAAVVIRCVDYTDVKQQNGK